MDNNIGEARRSYALTTESGVFTQEDAARELGVSLSTYRRWEQGVFKGLKGESLRKMADLYGVTTDYLLSLDTKPRRYTYAMVDIEHGGDGTPVGEIMRICGGLDEDGMERLLSYARFLATERGSDGGF